MELLSDAPIGIGEPHYVQAIRADRLKALEVYAPGSNPLTFERDANAIDGASTVRGWRAVASSYPEFADDLARLTS
jgi:hypothetical protein